MEGQAKRGRGSSRHAAFQVQCVEMILNDAAAKLEDVARLRAEILGDRTAEIIDPADALALSDHFQLEDNLVHNQNATPSNSARSRRAQGSFLRVSKGGHSPRPSISSPTSLSRPSSLQLQVSLERKPTELRQHSIYTEGSRQLSIPHSVMSENGETASSRSADPEELKACLLDSSKTVVRSLRDSKLLRRQLNAAAGEVAPGAARFIHCLKGLNDLFHKKMHLTNDEEASMSRQLIELMSKEEEEKKRLIVLREKLRDDRNHHASALKQADEQIARLEGLYEQSRKDEVSQHDRYGLELQNRCNDAEATFLAEENALKARLAALREELDRKGEESYVKEMSLHRKKTKREEQVAEMIATYDRSMKEKMDAWRRLTAQHDAESEERRRLHEIISKIDAERAVVAEEERLRKEARVKNEVSRYNHTQASMILQKLFRYYVDKVVPEGGNDGGKAGKKSGTKGGKASAGKSRSKSK